VVADVPEIENNRKLMRSLPLSGAKCKPFIDRTVGPIPQVPVQVP